MHDAGSIERILFAMLAQSHLEIGGSIGFRDKKWHRVQAHTYVMVDEKGETKGTWGNTMDAISALNIEINRERRIFDEVYFFFLDNEESYEGVTWRMLKIDMSFLRLVLASDQFTMKEIIRRFVQISEKTQAGENDKKPFQNLN